MVVSRKDYPSMFEIMTLRGAFDEEVFNQDDWYYYCTFDDHDFVACQFKHAGHEYYMSYRTSESDGIECNVTCEDDAAEFLKYLKATFFRVVPSRDCIKSNPDDAYFDIDGTIVELNYKMCGLLSLWENADLLTLIHGGKTPWQA